MIQANEIKPNNIIDTPYGIATVYGISKDCVQITLKDNESIFDFDLEDAKPIELTEDILLNNCGFKRADKNDSFGGILSPYLPNGNRIRLVNLEWKTQHYTTKFETLHHLQNWWYDNFQTELEINL